MAHDEEFWKAVLAAAIQKLNMHGLPHNTELGDPIESEDPQGEADFTGEDGTPYRIVMIFVAHPLVPVGSLCEDDGA